MEGPDDRGRAARLLTRPTRHERQRGIALAEGLLDRRLAPEECSALLRRTALATAATLGAMLATERARRGD